MYKNLFVPCTKIRTWALSLYANIDGKFIEQFDFRLKDVTFKKLTDYLHKPVDSSSLAVTRILFGLAMLFDIPDERGGSVMEKRWGDPTICRFPLIPIVKAVPMPFMALVYAALWLGALGITLGYKYRLSATVFTICYWYLFLIEKSYWNNHSYLFGVVALLLATTEANCYWSLDSQLGITRMKQTVPYWNYFILKYQFFILYFMAGMKKGTAEWLTGYSVQNLSEHWVFSPFKLFLTVPQTDFLIVHWFVFAFDISVAIWMMWSRTRNVAMIFCALFHLMNSRLFRIGMFPWVCLATMPLFYSFDWPKTIMRYAEKPVSKVKGGICTYLHKFKLNTTSGRTSNAKVITKVDDNEPKAHFDNDKSNEQNSEDLEEKIDNEEKGTEEENTSETKDDEIFDDENNSAKTSEDDGDRRKYITFIFIVFHVFTQAFLPYSHFITKGYNNWTNGLYGYSWDMMVHTWEIESVIVKVVDNENKGEFYVDPYIYSPNDRWTRHGDMVYQYARCLKENILKQFIRNKGSNHGKVISNNISIYVDVWCSMNGRFTQRMFDSKTDLLNTFWSPFEPIRYLMPLLDEALPWRSLLHEIKEDVHSWNNYSDVTFIADFPDYYQEKFIPMELTNVTMTILEGVVAFEPEVEKFSQGQSYKLNKGSRVKLVSGTFHRVLTIGTKPAFYMYTFTNSSEPNIENSTVNPKLPVWEELARRFNNMIKFAKIVVTNIISMFFQRCQ
ncbi:vitamin K-dependent gamma-carboxylase [Vanessa cardui]|uniref:vitamin K-dependent gamma-carboxylase n=1 Tax=Vanessa cardui TaxID=171605 RepID=UPI001F12F7EB|nr:vitamin K-dependent gamma-carboxylase [Vanessa cardui]